MPPFPAALIPFLLDRRLPRRLFFFISSFPPDSGSLWVIESFLLTMLIPPLVNEVKGTSCS